MASRWLAAVLVATATLVLGLLVLQGRLSLAPYAQLPLHDSPDVDNTASVAHAARAVDACALATTQLACEALGVARRSASASNATAGQQRRPLTPAPEAVCVWDVHRQWCTRVVPGHDAIIQLLPCSGGLTNQIMSILSALAATSDAMALLAHGARSHGPPAGLRGHHATLPPLPRPLPPATRPTLVVVLPLVGASAHPPTSTRPHVPWLTRPWPASKVSAKVGLRDLPSLSTALAQRPYARYNHMFDARGAGEALHRAAQVLGLALGPGWHGSVRESVRVVVTDNVPGLLRDHADALRGAVPLGHPLSVLGKCGVGSSKFEAVAEGMVLGLLSPQGEVTAPHPASAVGSGARAQASGSGSGGVAAGALAHAVAVPCVYGCAPPVASGDPLIPLVQAWVAAVAPSPSLCRDGVAPVLAGLAARATAGFGAVACAAARTPACPGAERLPCFAALHVRLESDMCKTAPTAVAPKDGPMSWHDMRGRMCRTTPAVSEECIKRLGPDVFPQSGLLYVAVDSITAASPAFQTWRQASAFDVVTKEDLVPELRWDASAGDAFRFGREELALIDLTVLRQATAFMGAGGSSFSRFVEAEMRTSGRPSLSINLDDRCLDLLQRQAEWGSAPEDSPDSWGWHRAAP